MEEAARAKRKRRGGEEEGELWWWRRRELLLLLPEEEEEAKLRAAFLAAIVLVVVDDAEDRDEKKQLVPSRRSGGACFLMKKRRSRSKSESDDDAEIPIKFDVKSRAPPPPRSLYALLRTLSTSALAVGRSRSAASDVRRWSIEREFFSRSIDFFFSIKPSVVVVVGVWKPVVSVSRQARDNASRGTTQRREHRALYRETGSAS